MVLAPYVVGPHRLWFCGDRILMSNGGMHATGDVAKSVVSSLGASPAMLALICLNCAFVGAAAWYLLKQENFRHLERMSLLERCYETRSKE